MPLRSSRHFNKVAIIGVGLIGGSIGKAIKKRRLAREVVGLSQKHTTLSIALKNQAIDHGYHDVKKVVTNADLVVLAAPVSVITGLMSIIAPHLRRNCIITDVGSTKIPIVQAAELHFKGPYHFVGSHPLAGSEKRGIQYADANLFENSTCIMTPRKNTHRGACDRVKQFWISLGAKVKFLSPEEHDQILAFTSHLPHLLAFSLMNVIPNDCLEYTAKGFKDSTRIAASSSQMWNDIFMGNSKNLMKCLDEYVKILSSIRRALRTGDHKGLTYLLKTAKNKRDRLNQ